MQRRPLCDISVRAVRLQNSTRHLRDGPVNNAKSNAKPGSAAWLGQRVGLALAWLQRAAEGTAETSTGKKKEGLVSIFANHCSFVTGQRLRRAFQIGELYSNLYSERTRWTLVGNIWRRLQSKGAPTRKLLAALAGVFMWEDEKIRDEELRR